MLVKLKHEPKLTLAHLLKRKKRTLKQFIEEFGITTYAGLVARCERMGIVPHSEEEFAALNVPVVSNPSEGVVVIEPAPTKERKQRRKKEAEDTSDIYDK